MGGNGSGGQRIGAGRKSKRLAERALSGARHKTTARDAGVSGPAPVVPVPRPADLPESQRMFWDALAPHATAAGTLTAGTVMAFRDLCEAIVLRRAMAAQLAVDGLMVNAVKLGEDGERYSLGAPTAHPLIVHERGMRQRVEAGMQKFALSPMGKSVVKVADPVDEFAEFDAAPLTLVKGGK